MYLNSHPHILTGWPWTDLSCTFDVVYLPLPHSYFLGGNLHIMNSNFPLFLILFCINVYIFLMCSFLGLPALIHAIIDQKKSIWWYRSPIHPQIKLKTHTQEMESSSTKCFSVILHKIAIKSIKCKDGWPQLWILLRSCINGCSVDNPFRNALWPEPACAKFLHQSWHSALPR